MNIYYKDYRIQVDTYSWSLYKKYVVKKDTLKKDGSIHRKAGSIKWIDEGFFTSLDSLFNKMARLETEKMEGDIQLSDYLILWYDIVKNFTNQCEVIKDGAQGY